MSPSWFKKRGYAHFDVPVGPSFAYSAERPNFVAQHSFLPLIHFTKSVKRYKAHKRKVEIKPRPIMYASHKDACILSCYASKLAEAIEKIYAEKDLHKNVIAYRKLGLSNYHFAREAMQFAVNNHPCMVLAYDVTKFFDTLDHKLLKARLKKLLTVDELPPDWYSIFRFVTRFNYVDYDDLKSHSIFGARINERKRQPIATARELKAAGIPIHTNRGGIGIPQGTPISSLLANLYLIDFDIEMAAHAREVGGLYRRYSDDILFICQEIHAEKAEEHVDFMLSKERLKISHDKTEKTIFAPGSNEAAQYLGFRLQATGASIRASSMSRQVRRMKWAVKRTFLKGENAVASGSAKKVYTKKLYRRFTKVPLRNFISYGMNASEALSSPQVSRQVKRMEKRFLVLIRDYKKSRP